MVAAVVAIVGQAIGYVIGREFGYRLLLRYGPYVRVTESRIKARRVSVPAARPQDHRRRPFRPAVAQPGGHPGRGEPHAVAAIPAANSVGAFAWASVFGFAAYFLGHEVEHVAGPVMIVIGIIAVIALAHRGQFRQQA